MLLFREKPPKVAPRSTLGERMKHARQTVAVLGALGGFLVLMIAVILVGGRPKSISIQYLGLRDTPWPDGPRPLFLITNPTPYRITWSMLAPEFQLASGWTTTQTPKVSIGGKARDLKFGGETLPPGASFEIYGIAPTNAPYRCPVLWGLHPADALLRPKWKQLVDKWCERVRVRPLFLPYGVQRTPVVPAKSPNQGGAKANRQPVGSETNHALSEPGPRR
jgi:hypothetical protein